MSRSPPGGGSGRSVRWADMRGGVTQEGENRVTWSRAFHTRYAGDPPDRIRTYGRVLEYPSGFGWPTGFAHEAGAPPALGADAARGKVAVLRLGPNTADTASFQLADTVGHAEIAACSNATAASVARCAISSGSRTPTLNVVLPGACDARVVADVRHWRDASSVRQTWLGVRVELGEDTEVDRRRVAVCSGALNNYLVVKTRPGESPGAFALADALALWRQFGMNRVPLLSRIAVVDGDDRGHPEVKFFTCWTRAHPSAPLTGLAVLALVSQSFKWFPTAPSTVGTPGGAVRVPRVHLARDGSAEVRFPEVLVTLPSTPDSRTLGA